MECIGLIAFIVVAAFIWAIMGAATNKVVGGHNTPFVDSPAQATGDLSGGCANGALVCILTLALAALAMIGLMSAGIVNR